MKKSLALVLSIILVLGLSTGCTNDAADSTTTAATVSAEPAGTLYVTFGPALEIGYDEEGNVLQITGVNEAGKAIAAECTDQVGKGCVFAARKFLRYAADNDLLANAKSMVVRVGFNDPLPAEDFLDTIVTDCQYLADEECTGIRLMALDADALDSSGNMIPEAARILAARFLDVEEEELFCEEIIVDGTYIFTCGDQSCAVDVFSGQVTAK